MLKVMQSLYSMNDFGVYPLTPKLVKKFSSDICASLNLIPLVPEYTLEKLLATTKEARQLYAKWQHSLIALDKELKFAGIIIAYERSLENNSQYPQNSIYLSDFSISSKYQKKGLGKFLLKSWLEYNQEVGMVVLEGNIIFSVQTNSADWNTHVQNLYLSSGFKKIAQKVYENRVDDVYFLRV